MIQAAPSPYRSTTTITATAADAASQIPPLLAAIVQAYAAGDTPYGEHLFTQALDAGLPWDQVCAAAAQGIAQCYGERDRA